MKPCRLHLLLGLLMTGLWLPTPAAEADPDPSPELQACRVKLNNIHSALQKYRRDHKTLPNYIQDLVPDYLADWSDLKCDTCVAAGKTSNDFTPFTDFDDKRATYTYEFINRPIPSNIISGAGHTMRAWKRLQMTVIGGGVPIVRCHCHRDTADAVTLNLSHDGVVYDSGKDWEDLYTDVANKVSLQPDILFGEFTERKILRFPLRHPKTDPRLIDLSAHYNGSLEVGWFATEPGNNLAELTLHATNSILTFDGVPFDVRGLIQLSIAESTKNTTNHFPRSVHGIQIGLPCSALHFLHATIFESSKGTEIGSYVMHYEDGGQEIMPIIYGHHLLDWWFNPHKDNRFTEPWNTTLAWTGSNEERRKDEKNIYLYHTTWKPRGGPRVITSLDFHSTEQRSGPFLVAITADTAEIPAKPQASP